MKIAKWGNSLAVRIPADVAEKAGLKEGDEVELLPPSLRHGYLTLRRTLKREDALAAIAKTSWILPPDYAFDRDEANARGPHDQ